MEVPRTASRSITTALALLDPQAPTVIARQQQNTLEDYHNFDCAEINDKSFRVIATHRNPFDRLWSFWKYRRNTGNPEIFKSISWLQYVDWVCDPSSTPQISGALLDCPIAEMFDLDRVDFWLDFEQLSESWQKLGKKYSLPLTPLVSINASPRYKHAADHLNESVAKRISDRFSQDFEYFGYSKDSWKNLTLADKNRWSENTDNNISNKQPERIKTARPKVAILTRFKQSAEGLAYSVDTVVQEQLGMLVLHGYNPAVLVVKSDDWSNHPGWYNHDSVEIIQYPSVSDTNQEGEEDQFIDDIELLTTALTTALSDVDVVLTHDIIYLPDHLKAAIAARNTAKQLPDITWFHWIHSTLSPEHQDKSGIAGYLYEEVLSQEWPNSHPVFFNRMSIPIIANNFHYEEADVRIVPHATDICRFFGFSPLTTRLYREKQLYMADYLTVCPVRLDKGKQVDWTIRIMARLKSKGECIRIVVMDSTSQHPLACDYREELKYIAMEYGLDQSELIFTSEFDDSLRRGAPQSMVRELFSISNIYIQPSRSESYSLSTQEAAITGNLLILNDDFPPFREIFGDQALFFQFGSAIDRYQLQDGATTLQIEDLEFPYKPVEYPDSLLIEKDDSWLVNGKAAHADFIASKIRYEFLNNIVLRQRQKRLKDRNLHSVFEKYLQPLICTNIHHQL
ncbi:MAG: glycosyltransferase [Gammaproteobacteria bacterium]|nr:glycosyltransferase [Gammaproteobacteria bacterium]